MSAKSIMSHSDISICITSANCISSLITEKALNNVPAEVHLLFTLKRLRQMAIKTTVTKMANGLPLHRAPRWISITSISCYILEIDIEMKRKSQRTERLREGEIKGGGGDYVIAQFISIRLWRELLNNSSRQVDQVIKYEMWEPNKFVR